MCSRQHQGVRTVVLELIRRKTRRHLPQVQQAATNLPTVFVIKDIAGQMVVIVLLV